jgi:hypothetical protein
MYFFLCDPSRFSQKSIEHTLILYLPGAVGILLNI